MNGTEKKSRRGGPALSSGVDGARARIGFDGVGEGGLRSFGSEDALVISPRRALEMGVRFPYVIGGLEC